jgi:hypothetical protein
MKLLKTFREYIYRKYHIWDALDLLPYRFRMYYYDHFKPIFFPKHKKVRAAVPRTWADITSMIVDVNFAMIKEFYEDEYLDGMVDWEGSSEGHKKFEQWLKEAYVYAAHKRPSLEAERDNSYPPSRPFDEWFEEKTDEKGRRVLQMKDDGVPYEVKYKDVIRLDKKIEENDTKFLKEMIEYREYFWT